MTSPQVSRNERIAFGLGSIITASWVISYILDILDNEYDPPTSVHALMLLVAGTVFGQGFIKSTKDRLAGETTKDDNG